MTIKDFDELMLDGNDEAIHNTKSIFDKDAKKFKMIQEDKAMTMRDIAVGSLLSEKPDQNLSVDDKVKNFDLFLKIKGGGKIDLDHPEMTRILDAVTKNDTILAAGRMRAFLNIKELKGVKPEVKKDEVKQPDPPAPPKDEAAQH